jgi:hypothetical protein
LPTEHLLGLLSDTDYRYIVSLNSYGGKLHMAVGAVGCCNLKVRTAGTV